MGKNKLMRFAENETFQFRKKLVEYQTKISNSLAKNQAVNDFAKSNFDINEAPSFFTLQS